MSPPCYLYIIEADYTLAERMECFKVGITNSVRSRLSSLQTGAPFRLTVVRTICLPNREVARVFERRMHEALNTWCVTGEWFCAYLTGALCELDSIAAKYWLEHGGDIESLPAWFAQIGLDAGAVEDVVAAEGLQ
jgi:hypothetical protein